MVVRSAFWGAAPCGLGGRAHPDQGQAQKQGRNEFFHFRVL